MSKKDSLVIDANVVIALLDPKHVHHLQAVKALEDYEQVWINPINKAEVLVGYPPHQQEQVDAILTGTGILCVAPTINEAALQYAQVATAINKPLPDAIAVATTKWVEQGVLFTFDKRLARAAQDAGFRIHAVRDS